MTYDELQAECELIGARVRAEMGYPPRDGRRRDPLEGTNLVVLALWRRVQELERRVGEANL